MEHSNAIYYIENVSHYSVNTNFDKIFCELHVKDKITQNQVLEVLI